MLCIDDMVRENGEKVAKLVDGLLYILRQFERRFGYLYTRLPRNYFRYYSGADLCSSNPAEFDKSSEFNPFNDGSIGGDIAQHRINLEEKGNNEPNNGMQNNLNGDGRNSVYPPVRFQQQVRQRQVSPVNVDASPTDRFSIPSVINNSTLLLRVASPTRLQSSIDQIEAVSFPGMRSIDLNRPNQAPSTFTVENKTESADATNGLSNVPVDNFSLKGAVITSSGAVKTVPVLINNDSDRIISSNPHQGANASVVNYVQVGSKIKEYQKKWDKVAMFK